MNPHDPANHARLKTVLQCTRSVPSARADKYPHAAPWDAAEKACRAQGIGEDAAGEALNLLLDLGILYEPTLGILVETEPGKDWWPAPAPEATA